MKKFLCLLACLWLGGVSVEAQKVSPVKFNTEGKFRIMQLTDLHHTADERSAHVLPMILRAIEIEKPDLIVITGDVVYTKPRPADDCWHEIFAALGKTGVPYALTLGNHDAEMNLSRSQIYQLVSQMPNCLNNSYEGGAMGTFAVPVLSQDGTKPAAVVYVMDSHDYNAEDHSYAGVDTTQVAWYVKQSQNFERQSGAKVNALMFMHIPLHEYPLAFDWGRVVGGFRVEREWVGRDNSGMFRALKKRGDVRGVFAGHDHSNNYVAMLDGIALGYGHYSGGYGEYQELVSGVRMFELNEGTPGFVTWERLISGRKERKLEITK